MKEKYFKHWAESDLGEGEVFFEAIGDEIARQVEVYGATLVWCDRAGQSDDRFMLADRPLSALGLDQDDEISAIEFEAAWSKAKGDR